MVTENVLPLTQGYLKYENDTNKYIDLDGPYPAPPSPMDGRMDRRMGGWVDGLMGGEMDGRTDG
eukprot:7876105-Karenia_brevis.AAC.1